MEFEKLKAPTLKQLFVEQLENMILSGKLGIGTTLPSERELAQSMQVSRSVVNSGINEMAAKGFLEIRPRVGTFVGDYRRNGTLETMLSIMKYNGGRLRQDEIRSILEIKLVLDSLVVRLAIPRLTEEDLSQLSSHLEAMKNSVTPEKCAQAAFTYYHELTLIGKNTLMPLLYCSFRMPILSLWERFCRNHGIMVLYGNTARLNDTLKERDEKAALACIEESVGNTIKGSTEIYLD